MAFHRVSVPPVLCVFLSMLPGVWADHSLTALVVAGAISFVLFIVFIVVLAMVVSWNRWYPALQRAKGKVKMPRSYWRKKKEAKQRLLMNTSRASRMTASTAVAQENGGMNGNATLVNRAKDTVVFSAGRPKASWVEKRLVAKAPSDANAYEDVTLTMELGEEKEEPEFRIETSIVDDETLDLGPFPSLQEDPTYSTVTPRPRSQQAPSTAAAAAAPAAAALSTTEVVISEQTITMQVEDDDDDDEGMAPKRDSFYINPLMPKPRQMTSSDTPPPPPPPPQAAEEPFAQFLDTSQVVF